MGDFESQFYNTVAAIFSYTLVVAARFISMKNKNNNNSKFQKTFQPLLNYKLWLPGYRTLFAMNCFHRFISGEELVSGCGLVMHIQQSVNTVDFVK